MSDTVHLSLEQVHDLAMRALIHNGMGEDHARAIAQVITQGQRDECHSHGLYRVLVCVRSLRSGKVSPVAQPTVSHPAPSIINIDAHRAYSLLALETGLPLLVEQARALGVAALVIRNCFHFSALWPEVEAIAAHGLVGMAMTPSHAWVAPHGGSKGVFGTNPLAFAWPRPGQEPFVFDFATSAIARGDIELHARQDKPIPLGWGLDAEGTPTTDAQAALGGAMQTFGGHKGSALAAMIELMAGALIGDMTSAQSLTFDGGAGATPCHGELLLAFDPKRFLGDDLEQGLQSAEQLFGAITQQGARLPSQRRFAARQRSERDGVFVDSQLIHDIEQLLV
ncbi:Ldh family oxidoreductase [Pseudomonas sp. NPDC090203]|uniref:Ldh family oxidoreductase n=1 Tax=Pseudomonas sp. NPDC090203 TaxID=3364477 RepID=UPI0037F29D3E